MACRIVARQQLRNKQLDNGRYCGTATEERYLLCSPCHLRLSHFEPLLLAACSEGTGIAREPRGREMSAVGSRYRATVSKDVTVDTSAYMCGSIMLSVR
jgi:hypothetical protein